MLKRIFIIGIAIILLLLLIVKPLFIKYVRAKHMAMPPPSVEVAKATSTNWQDEILATGTISAMNGITLKPEVAGRVTRIDFTSGSLVEKGQPLIQIYPDILAAQLAANEANLALAEVEYRRSAELYAKNVASKQTLDEQTAKLKSAQASVAATEAELAQHNITAPFSGRIGLKQIDIGDYVNVGESLVSLEEIDPLRIQFSIPDKYINQVKTGNTINIDVSSSPDKIYKGYVYALDASVDPQTRLFSIWGKIPNPDNSLVPGTYVTVSLLVGEPKPVLVIPQTAVVYSSQGEYVYKIEKNIAKKTQVSTGSRQRHLIVITDGLKPGDVVVTAGQVKLFDNVPIKIAKTTTYDNEHSPDLTVIQFTEVEKTKNMAEDKLPSASMITSVSPLPQKVSITSSQKPPAPTIKKTSTPLKATENNA